MVIPDDLLTGHRLRGLGRWSPPKMSPSLNGVATYPISFSLLTDEYGDTRTGNDGPRYARDTKPTSGRGSQVGERSVCVTH